MTESLYHIAIDTGGTFTDCLARAPDGGISRCKVLSNGSLRARIVRQISPTSFEIAQSWSASRDIFAGYGFRLLDTDQVQTQVESLDLSTGEMKLKAPLPELSCDRFEISAGEAAPILGARLITETALHELFPPLSLRLGTTRGTNALLERKGARVVCVVTGGFKDVFQIGTQQRPDIFALWIEKPKALCEQIIELDERLDVTGQVLREPDWTSLRQALQRAREQGIDVLAGALIHAWKNPVHEQALGALARELGFTFVSLSAELSQMVSFYGRAQTCAVNAYLAPVIHGYVERIRATAQDCTLQVMTSAGGLVRAQDFRPLDSLLSGPAGGCVGAAAIGRHCGCERVIGFDMGGTSTDVARYDQGFDYTYELQVQDATVFSPALRIETVAAGGGSICGFDGYKLTVGPESAGADPGPACYGAGGPLCITDVNLLAGRLDPGSFGIPVYPEQAQAALEDRVCDIHYATGKRPDTEELLRGYLAVANEIMAGAAKTVSVSRGYEPADYTLVAFGGAGGLHAGAVARILGMRTVLLPADAGLLSAYGLSQARVERLAEASVLAPLAEVSTSLEQRFARLQGEAEAALRAEGVTGDIDLQRLVFLRFAGQNAGLCIPFGDSLVQDFEQAYTRLYGHWNDQGVIEVASIRVMAATQTTWSEPELAEIETYQAQANGITDKGIPLYLRTQLRPGARIQGPALLQDPYSAAVIEVGWELEVHASGTAILVDGHEQQSLEVSNEQAALELYANRFMHMADTMGAMLQRTACSVNIKERLDFSCAILDAQGHLVANAHHIPVHLGGLGLCARRILEMHDLQAGDTIVTNHPALGGSHLPDITLLTPACMPDGQRIGLVICRAHHAEIGGVTPGSMPPSAQRLAEEGVLIEPFYLLRQGQADWAGMREILSTGPYASRMIQENLADLNAQLAANQQGVSDLQHLAAAVGHDTVQHYFTRIRENAAGKVLDLFRQQEQHSLQATEELDDGSQLRVNIEVKPQGRTRIDFTGSAPVHPGNLNGTEAVCLSALMYVLRVLVDEPIPLNDGMLDPVEVVLPGCILSPHFDDNAQLCPAVGAGNVELSQRLVDTLLKAFGAAAAGQGTMNNLLFGDASFGYYETIGGGSGAVAGHAGADAVHQHMTNTRITDVELMELRYPVRVWRFAVRPGSGGRGEFPGGNGIIRDLEFLRPLTVSVIAQRRQSGPYGLQGGADGQPGRQYLIFPNGSEFPFQDSQSIEVEAGTRLGVETPGGGGWGKDPS